MKGFPAGRRRLNELAHRYLTEGATPLRQSSAVGLGLFIGCLPIYGLHLPLCLALGAALGLNRLKLYLAANVSNPVLAPVLVLASIQIAGRLQNGVFYPLSLETVRAGNPWEFGVQLVWGSALLGLGLGALGFLATYLVKLRTALAPAEEDFLEQAAKPYAPLGILTWWRVSARLRRDPFYRAVGLGRILPVEGALLDVSCGSGELLSALRAGRKPGASPGSLVGIEKNRRRAATARAALEDATIIEDDALSVPFPPSRVVFLVDVLGRAGDGAAERLLQKAATSLESGGAILIRERDGDGRKWIRALEELGLESDDVDVSGQGIFRAVKRPALTPS